MAIGRPRTTSLSDDEMVAMGIEMISWLEEHPETLHLSEWYTIHKGYLYEEWKCFIRMDFFRPYYEQALKIVGKQYLDKNSNVRDGISQRWQRVYFKDIKEQEDADLQLKLDKELEQKKKIIDHQSSKELGNLISPFQDTIDKDHLIMKLQHRLAELEANANKPQAE